MAAMADNAEDEFGHFQVQKVVLDLEAFDCVLTLLHQPDQGAGEILVEGEAEFAVFFTAPGEGEGGDVGVERVHARLLWEMVHDGRILDGDGGFGDEVGEAVADPEGLDAGGEAAELLHALDQGVELHAVESDMGVQGWVAQDAVPNATSTVFN